MDELKKYVITYQSAYRTRLLIMAIVFFILLIVGVLLSFLVYPSGSFAPIVFMWMLPLNLIGAFCVYKWFNEKNPEKDPVYNLLFNHPQNIAMIYTVAPLDKPGLFGRMTRVNIPMFTKDRRMLAIPNVERKDAVKMMELFKANFTHVKFEDRESKALEYYRNM